MPLKIDSRSEYKKDKIKEEFYLPSDIENIDASFVEYMKQTLDVHCTTNKGWERVPVLWTSAERSHQIKNNKDVRDKDGVLKYPLITIHRDSISKDNSQKGAIQAVLPSVGDNKGGYLVIARKVKQDKTANFQNARSKRLYSQNNYRDGKAEKTVYETITIDAPTYVNINYKITFYSNFSQQINEMLTPFISNQGNVNYWVLKRNGHVYEAFPGTNYSFNDSAGSLGEEEKRFATEIDVRVLGYLMGEGKNDSQPKIVRRESAVEVKIPRERVITGDINEYLKEQGFYRS